MGGPEAWSIRLSQLQHARFDTNKVYSQGRIPPNGHPAGIRCWHMACSPWSDRSGRTFAAGWNDV